MDFNKNSENSLLSELRLLLTENEIEQKEFVALRCREVWKIIEHKRNSDLELHSLLVKILLASEDNKTAFEIFEKIIDIEDLPSQWIFEMARSMDNSGFWEKAGDSYMKAALKEKDKMPAWYAAAGNAFLRGKAYENARESLTIAVAMQPGNGRWMASLGKAEEGLHNWSAAEAAYVVAVDIDPDNLYWKYRLGLSKEKQKKWHEARSIYEEYLVKSPGKSIVLFRLSLVLFYENRMEDALEKVNSALNFSSDFTLLTHKARILLRLQRLQESSEILGELVTVDGCSANIWHLYGVCEKAQRHWGTAKDAFLKAVQLKPNFARWHADVAAMWVKVGDAEKAIFSYRNAVAIDAGQVGWWAELGRLLADNKPQEAIFAYQQGADLGRLSLCREIDLLNNKKIVNLEPVSLMSSQRLDIAAKVIYAQRYLKLSSENSYISRRDIYRKHIFLRTGGQEPGNLSKETVDDYEEDFGKLIDSIRIGGFDCKKSIPVAEKNNAIFNGAHRLSAALALGLESVPVSFLHEDSSLSWNVNWFVQRGFLPEEIDEILLCWLKLNSKNGNLIILWPASQNFWDEISKTIESKLSVACSRSIDMGVWGIREFMYDCYSMKGVADHSYAINRKVDRLVGLSTRIRFFVVSSPVEQLTQLKNEIRDRYRESIPVDWFFTLHASDSHEEAMHLARILLHRPTLNLLKSRTAPLSKNIVEWVAEAKSALKAKKISSQDACAVGGAVLNAYGLREAGDLDITVKGSDREAYFDVSASPLSKNVDIVRKGYARDFDRKTISDDQLIQDRALHVQIRGFKFASLDVVRRRKSVSSRDKDKIDLELIGKHLFEII